MPRQSVVHFFKAFFYRKKSAVWIDKAGDFSVAVPTVIFFTFNLCTGFQDRAAIKPAEPDVQILLVSFRGVFTLFLVL